MSDLAATNCGSTCGCGCESGAVGGGNCMWLILILLFCGGCGGNMGGGCGCGGNEGSGCGSIIWIILILCLCGNGGFGC